MTRILLGCGASAALHKAADLASKLKGAGHEVHAVLTPNADRLVSAQLFEALTGHPALVHEFGEGRMTAMDHISLAQGSELLLVAPATADLVGRLAHGLATDLLTTMALAIPASVPRVIVPAMNPHMWAQPAVGRNLATLAGDGWRVLQPETGEMACGDVGPGRFPETADLLQRLADLL
ncbi:MAG: flavoprotein [Planctomycetota bacterium]|nr:flavoprotein [Planctomycetota bacterium]